MCLLCRWPLLVSKKRPRHSVIILTAGAGEGGGVGALHFAGAAGEGVVHEPLGDGGAIGHLGGAAALQGFWAVAGLCAGVGPQVVPAEVAFAHFAVGGGDAGAGGGAAAFARQAYAYQALAVGEDDAAGGVVPGVALVALHDGELHAVDEQQLVQRQAQGLGHQHVDFDQGHAAGVVAAQGAIAHPGAGERGPEIVRQARVAGLAPALVGKVQVIDLFPEWGVVGGEAVEGQGARGNRA